jgi:hypothetical protein
MLIRELCGEHRWVFQRIIRGKAFRRERKGNRWSDPEKQIIGAIHRQGISSGLLRLVSIPGRDEQLYIGPRIGLKNKPDAAASNSENISFRNACLRIATSQTACLKTMMKPLPM